MNPDIETLFENFLQLARTALTGRLQDVQLVLHRSSKKFRSSNPELADALVTLLQESPTRSTPLRKHLDTPLPVDIDSRLNLLRLEVGAEGAEPILSESIHDALAQVLSERKNIHALHKHGLQPTKSLLFTGPPGVGKTMAAKWVAYKLGRPLVILDLAAVMSSYLGRTGNNIRFVLDYAKKTECVLLLDELDAIAKRRDDNSEIGELKRLVTVLLQEIDDWPSSGLLIAATNHPDLLDPAVWRRFENVLRFELPSILQTQQMVANHLREQLGERANEWAKVLSYIFVGKSFSEIERQITISRKAAAIGSKTLEDELDALLNDIRHLSIAHKKDLAMALTQGSIVSQRRASEITGLSRDTIRKHSTNSSK